MTITLLRANSTSTELELYTLLCQASTPDIPGWIPAAELPIEEAVRAIEYFETYFIYKDAVPVGTLSLEYRSVDELYVDEIGIVPEYWGQRIAGAALTLALKPRLNLKDIWLVTHPMNRRAIKLYERLGFEIMEWRNNYFGGKEPRYILELTDRTKILG